MNHPLLEFVRDACRVSGWRLSLLVAATLTSAVLEGLTIAALLPLLASVSQQSSGATDRVVALVEAILAAVGATFTAFNVGVLIAGLIMVSAAVFLYQARLAARLQADYVASWQRRLFEAFFAADFAFFRNRRNGDLIAAAVTEPVRLGRAFYLANLIATSAIYVTIQVAIALFIAPFVVVLLLIIGLLLFVMTRPFALRSLRHGRGLSSVNADFQTEAVELIEGAKLVKATSTEARAVERLSSTVERLRRLTFEYEFDTQVVRAVFEYTAGLSVVSLLVAGPTLLAVDVSAILVVVAMFVRLFPKVTALRQCLQSIGLALPAFDSVSGLLRDADEAREAERANCATHAFPAGPAHIALDDVSVTEGGRSILSGLNVVIPAGAFVVIVGPTGAGKTTLLDCILGLRHPTTGRVMVDDADLSRVPASAWRRGIGYLGQDPTLFNASVGENLRWIMPLASDDALREALSKASADFVEHLPLGLLTLVGDRGNLLSGGERQRLALARALLGEPRLLVLDEATSALDAATEEAVVATVRLFKGRTTVVAITHRPALMSAADLVVELRDGRVVKTDHRAIGSLERVLHGTNTDVRPV